MTTFKSSAAQERECPPANHGRISRQFDIEETSHERRKTNTGDFASHGGGADIAADGSGFGNDICFSIKVRVR